MILLTDAAVKQLQTLLPSEAATASTPSQGLRIAVEKGGCAGWQYGMSMDSIKEGDLVCERDGVQVLIDPESVQFLRGSTIDYADDLTGSGFRIQNPNAVRSCGCGTSFESPPEAQTADASTQTQATGA